MRIPPHYVCSRVSGLPPVIDGRLDDEAWGGAASVTLRLHDDSGAPRFSTTARLLYDAERLYVAFECEDSRILADMTERDDPIFDEEVVEIFIDPDSDLVNYYEFEVSPHNVIFDAVVRNPSGVKCELDATWDCEGLRTAVSRAAGDSGSWAVEMAIPFAALNGAPHAGDRWRMNLYRIERLPDEEYICWSPTMADPANFHVPARFGTIEFA